MKDDIKPLGQNVLAAERFGPTESQESSVRLHASSLVRWLVYISRFGLAAFFLFTAGAKLWFISFFVNNVGELLSSMHLNYERWMWPATIGVISIEFVTALLLLLARTVRLGALLSAALLIGFSAFALYYVYVLHG
jgi:Methylamine utilisation protein MauE